MSLQGDRFGPQGVAQGLIGAAPTSDMGGKKAPPWTARPKFEPPASRVPCPKAGYEAIAWRFGQSRAAMPEPCGIRDQSPTELDSKALLGRSHKTHSLASATRTESGNATTSARSLDYQFLSWVSRSGRSPGLARTPIVSASSEGRAPKALKRRKSRQHRPRMQQVGVAVIRRCEKSLSDPFGPPFLSLWPSGCGWRSSRWAWRCGWSRSRYAPSHRRR